MVTSHKDRRSVSRKAPEDVASRPWKIVGQLKDLEIVVPPRQCQRSWPRLLEKRVRTVELVEFEAVPIGQGLPGCDDRAVPLIVARHDVAKSPEVVRG